MPNPKHEITLSEAENVAIHGVVGMLVDTTIETFFIRERLTCEVPNEEECRDCGLACIITKQTTHRGIGQGRDETVTGVVVACEAKECHDPRHVEYLANSIRSAAGLPLTTDRADSDTAKEDSDFEATLS